VTKPIRRLLLALLLVAPWHAALAQSDDDNGQGGRIIKLGGKLPVNLSAGAYYNALRPQYGSTWQVKTEITHIF
jgi:hypothetical protein